MGRLPRGFDAPPPAAGRGKASPALAANDADAHRQAVQEAGLWSREGGASVAWVPRVHRLQRGVVERRDRAVLTLSELVLLH